MRVCICMISARECVCVCVTSVHCHLSHTFYLCMLCVFVSCQRPNNTRTLYTLPPKQSLSLGDPAVILTNPCDTLGQPSVSVYVCVPKVYGKSFLLCGRTSRLEIIPRRQIKKGNILAPDSLLKHPCCHAHNVQTQMPVAH